MDQREKDFMEFIKGINIQHLIASGNPNLKPLIELIKEKVK